jgi:hypothetical protein
MSGSLQTVLQAAIGDRVSLDPFSFRQNDVAASDDEVIGFALRYRVETRWPPKVMRAGDVDANVTGPFPVHHNDG